MFRLAARRWRSTGTWASADKPKRWPNDTKVIAAGRARTASKPVSASVNGWTTTLGCSSWATRQAAPPMGGLKEPTGAGSMKTTITVSPKNNSSIRRSDLSTADVDEGVSNTGLVVPGSETDRRLYNVGTGTHGSEPSSAGAVSAIHHGRAPCRTARYGPRQRASARRADRPQRAGSDSVSRTPSPVNFADLQERVPLASELTKSDWDTARQCLNRRIQAWRALEV
jgi:hypothetical protein